MVEFTRLCPVLCFPSLALEKGDKMIDEHCEMITSSFETLDEAPDLFPKLYQEDEEKSAIQMNNYLL